jgi:hypothetical protein
LPVAEDGRDDWESGVLNAIERVVALLSLRQRSVFILKYRQVEAAAGRGQGPAGTVKVLHHWPYTAARDWRPGRGENERMP